MSTHSPITKKGLIILTMLSLTLIPLFNFGQKKYDSSLLYEISSNNSEKKSYLYGTMHVSSRIAFHLPDAFFTAIENCDMIALESDPKRWLDEYTKMERFNTYTGYSRFEGQNLYKNDFQLTIPENEALGYLFGQTHQFINPMLFRSNPYQENFQEDTYLDMFIYQTGNKLGKHFSALEDFKESHLLYLKAGIPDEEPKKQNISYEDRYKMNLRIENAYRNGNLHLLDSIQNLLSPSENYLKYFLVERNRNMVDKLDSLMQSNSVFAGVGAAHLAGKGGMLAMLEAKGYTVRPMEREITNIAINKKEEFEAMHLPRSFKTFYAEDSLFTFKLPDNYHNSPLYPGCKEYIYPDIVNSNQFSILRVSHFGKFNNFDSHYQMERLDSLFFEYIPGDIQKKEKIVNTYPGYDIHSIDKKGNHIRIQVYVSPLEIIIVKLSGKNNYALSDEANTFFNSLQFFPDNKNTGKVNLPYANFEINMPGQVIAYEGNRDMNNQFSRILQSNSDSNYYLLINRENTDNNYIEEDKFEHHTYLKEFIRQFSSFESEINPPIHTNTHGDYYTTAYKKGDSSIMLKASTRIVGDHYYLLATISDTATSTDDFFNSFKFKESNYPPGSLYTDSIIGYTVKAPFHPDYYDILQLKAPNFSMTKKTKKEQNHLAKYQHFNYSNDTIHEDVTIEKIKFQKYFSRPNIELLSDYIKTFYEKELSLKPSSIHSESYDSIDKIDITFKRKNSGRVIWKRHYIINNECYILSTKYDSTKGASHFAKSFFSSFKPLTPEAKNPERKSAYDETVKMLLQDLQSADSITRTQARASIEAVYCQNKHSEEFINFLSRPNTKFVDIASRKALINKMGELDNEKTFEFIKKHYDDVADTSGIQIAILQSLASKQNKKAIDLVKELLLKNTPLSTKQHEISAIFYNMDSLELTRRLFPDILELSFFPEYKNDIYGVLAELVENGFINKKNLRRWKNILTREANFSLKRQLATDYEDEFTNREWSNTKLLTEAKILKPFIKDKKVKAFFKKAIKKLNKYDRLNFMVLLQDTKLRVHDSLWTEYAKDVHLRKVLTKKLIQEKRMDLFDSNYLSHESISESFLHSKEKYSKIDSLVHIKTHTFTDKEHEGIVCIYKSRNNENKQWSYAYVYFTKKDFGKLKFNDIRTKKDIDISILKSEDEQIQEMIDMIIYESHPRCYQQELSNVLHNEFMNNSYY